MSAAPTTNRRAAMHPAPSHLESMSTAELRDYRAELRALSTPSVWAEQRIGEISAILNDRERPYITIECLASNPRPMSQYEAPIGPQPRPEGYLYAPETGHVCLRDREREASDTDDLRRAYERHFEPRAATYTARVDVVDPSNSARCATVQVHSTDRNEASRLAKRAAYSITRVTDWRSTSVDVVDRAHEHDLWANDPDRTTRRELPEPPIGPVF